jgi:alginate O-acetyltransferase complex protein AlgI
MSFGTPIFLFLFLPIALSLYFLARGRVRILIALLSSLAFYAWGNPVLLLPILGVIGINYWLGIQIEKRRSETKSDRMMLITGVLFNLALLVFYKALSGLASDLLVHAGHPQYIWIFQTPLGLSYIAFQLISYLADVYDEKCASEKDPLAFALYILLFPRIIAGPITAYRNLREQLLHPQPTPAEANAGIRRFILGLAKKLLIADQLAALVDPVFQHALPDLSAPTAWLIIVAYALQIFFDFSGYTDMAIGLGSAMGFRFAENFNFPYLANSISEFWRRWHMSLVGWFREYVFFPLEFARRKSKFFRTQINILIVFTLTGLWHGFTWNFLMWGMLQGLVLGLELTKFGQWMKAAWRPWQHAYTLLVILVGWVFFRSTNIPFAMTFLKDMVNVFPANSLPVFAELSPISNTFWLALAVGLVFSVPIVPAFKRKLVAFWPGWPGGASFLLGLARDVAMLALFLFCILVMVNSTHQAYIYMQF